MFQWLQRYSNLFQYHLPAERHLFLARLRNQSVTWSLWTLEMACCNHCSHHCWNGHKNKALSLSLPYQMLCQEMMNIHSSLETPENSTMRRSSILNAVTQHLVSHREKVSDRKISSVAPHPDISGLAFFPLNRCCYFRVRVVLAPSFISVLMSLVLLCSVQDCLLCIFPFLHFITLAQLLKCI